ncbi:DUF2339 domain-containing protein [Lutibacter sp. B2]|nr:DUF2339 domain-containing protein [Lutibacter sp. B2]
MEIREKIDRLLSGQKEVLKQYEGLIKELNVNDAVNENIALKKEIEKYKNTTKELEINRSKLADENMAFKIALKEQMINEKNALLNASKKKVDIYFQKESKGAINKLQALEVSAKGKIDKIQKVANRELNTEKEEVFSKINTLKLEIKEKITERKNHVISEKDNLLQGIKREYNELKNESLSEEAIEKKKKYNDLEVKIGLSWINKIGVILLLLGISTAMKYTFSTWFNVYMKGISGFLLGGVFLGTGEWFNRKDKNIFALGLCGGGIGILYLSVFSCYFILGITGIHVSMIISLLITMVSITLSLRYNSMTICGVSLFGGYLPFFSYVFVEGLSEMGIYIAMAYLIILNLLVLGISIKRKWVYINYISFILNIPCLVYLTTQCMNETIGIVYAILTFVMYLLITLIYPMKENVKLKKMDVALLSLNTVVNSLLVYSIFENGGYSSFKGILALMYSLIYLALGQHIRKNASQEEGTEALFYITAMTFAVLMIPFQIGMKWACLGWLIESILLIYYGGKNDVLKMEFVGWIVFILCFLDFVAIDFLSTWAYNYFMLKYTIMTLGVIYILSLYVHKLNSSEFFKDTKKGKLLFVFKYFTIVNSWIYIVRMVNQLYDSVFDKMMNSNMVDIIMFSDFYYYILMAVATALFAYIVSKIHIIQDHIVKNMVLGLYIIVDVIGIYINLNGFEFVESVTLRAISMVIIILYDVFVFFSIRDIIIKIIEKRCLSIEIYPIILAVYILGISTTFLIEQFNFNNINLIVSIFFIVMSFVYIVYGFKKKFMLIRRLGLGLSIFATGKLFIFDLAFLSVAGKIIGYICFGFVLIGISYIYHRLKNSLDREGVNE